MTNSFAKECGSPVECYTLAVDKLNEARKEMQSTTEHLNSEIKGVSQQIKEAEAKLEAEMKKKMDENEKKLNDKLAILESKIKSIEDGEITIQSKAASLVTAPMYNKDVVIHENIIDALDRSLISKEGSPKGWNETTYRTNLWNKKTMISIGTNSQAHGNGLRVNPPEGYDLLWVCEGDTSAQYHGFTIYSVSNPSDPIVNQIVGHNFLNTISPDGSIATYGYSEHKWFAFPLFRKGPHVIQSLSINTEHWISGIGYGKNNIWNHVVHYSYNFVLAINGGDKAADYGSWNNATMFKVDPGTRKRVRVPIISNGTDKMLYFITHNDAWDQGIYNVMVNNSKIERPRTDYFNAFSRHHNSKPYERYIACKVPKELLKAEDRFIDVQIDMTQWHTHPIYIRSIGTHDYFPTN
eukprot:CAMPEP_0170518760 /NCGR_PEP_ID=MMETSP0209-20121228/4377_1 /TAXON_ID=665100 ORGANISM="Litonotus pictus, Strain P1" /NCGR_SAMPLE_ID=MMETSP0209 /ASSEMBLY_ACC=CAM_ASM_000301 /LENGTH=408 /DNA_ID=CAMNT_0010804437 /DNA_START=38 /DNA_END=1264 /DNA_ORIENTATION=-